MDIIYRGFLVDVDTITQLLHRIYGTLCQIDSIEVSNWYYQYI